MSAVSFVLQDAHCRRLIFHRHTSVDDWAAASGGRRFGFPAPARSIM